MMVDQVVINFPELPDEIYEAILNIREKITVELWKSDERKKFPLKWEGTRLCCPITIWFDFPEDLVIQRSLLNRQEQVK